MGVGRAAGHDDRRVLFGEQLGARLRREDLQRRWPRVDDDRALSAQVERALFVQGNAGLEGHLAFAQQTPPVAVQLGAGLRFHGPPRRLVGLHLVSELVVDDGLGGVHGAGWLKRHEDQRGLTGHCRRYVAAAAAVEAAAVAAAVEAAATTVALAVGEAAVGHRPDLTAGVATGRPGSGP